MRYLICILALSIAFAPTVSVAQDAKKPTPKTAPAHKITAEKAQAIALAKFKGKVTKKPVLEKEDGRWQWEVIVVNGKKMTEVNVDAETGKINSSEAVTAKEEAQEMSKKKG